MEEQRMLDEMERALAAEDPRFAARLNAFGEQHLMVFTSPRARTISGLIALLLIAAVTVTMFVLSPYARHHATSTPPTTPSAQSSRTHSSTGH
jgi:hypothetical protein